MALKPWYDVVKPREDLREGKPLDASEFAVHLDKVRTGSVPSRLEDVELKDHQKNAPRVGRVSNRPRSRSWPSSAASRCSPSGSPSSGSMPP